MQKITLSVLVLLIGCTFSDNFSSLKEKIISEEDINGQLQVIDSLSSIQIDELLNLAFSKTNQKNILYLYTKVRNRFKERLVDNVPFKLSLIRKIFESDNYDNIRLDVIKLEKDSLFIELENFKGSNNLAEYFLFNISNNQLLDYINLIEDINIEDSSGLTLIEWVASNSFKEPSKKIKTLEILTNRNPILNHVNKYSGQNILHLFVWTPQEADYEWFLDRVLLSGVDINALDSIEESALHKTIFPGYEDFPTMRYMKYLITKGAEYKIGAAFKYDLFNQIYPGKHNQSDLELKKIRDGIFNILEEYEINN